MFDWIVGLLKETGYFGIAFLMFAENVFPPIPSELIMPFAGFTAASHEINLYVAILAGSVGSLLGAILWYYIGVFIGAARLKRFATRHGRWLTLTPDDIDEACKWFNRHSGRAVFFGRLVPAVRTFISVPAGIAGMPFGTFLVYTAAGTVLWTALLATAGYLLESQYDKVSQWLNPVSNLVIGVLVLIYLYRVATFRRRVPKQ